MPNYNKKELALLKEAEQMYMVENNLRNLKRTVPLTKKIIKLAHDRYELVGDPGAHEVMRAIQKKCGEHIELPEEKVIREANELKVKQTEAKKAMADSIREKHEQEMKEEMEYYGVIDKPESSIPEPISTAEMIFDVPADSLEEADKAVKEAIEKELAEEGPAPIIEDAKEVVKEIVEKAKPEKMDIEDILDSL